MARDKPDTVVPLSRFRAALARPRGGRRLDALLSERDPEAAVAALSVTELHELVTDVGLADCHDLLALASGEQVRGCLDLELWERDRLDASRALPWLAAVLAAGYEKAGQIWEALDKEVAALLLARHARIYDTTFEEEPPEDTPHSVYKTPDTFFYVEITAEDDDDVRLVIQLLEDLYRADPQLARHTLMAARSEPQPELEEMSYRWRSGRMADLGYVDYYEALEVYRPVAADGVRIGEGSAEPLDPALDGDEARAPKRLPARLLDVAVGRAFLAQVLDRITDAAEAQRLEAALLLLVNKVLAAAQVRPGDPEAREVGTHHATSTLALGLEIVAGGDPDRAVEAISTISLTRLHRVGHSATLRLGRLARGLAPRAAAAGDADAALLGALLGARPFYARHLDGAGETGVRPFESQADLRRAAEALTRLALRIAAVDSLGVDLLGVRDGAEHVELDDYLRTALARAALGQTLSPAPLLPGELRALAERSRGETLPDEVRERAAGALEEHLDRAAIEGGRIYLPGLIEGWLGDLASALAPLAGHDEIDPGLVAGLLVAPARPSGTAA
jgi:hypothetical protein